MKTLHSTLNSSLSFHKAVIQHTNRLFKVLVIHAEDDIQFVGTLVDHTDVDQETVGMKVWQNIHG